MVFWARGENSRFSFRLFTLPDSILDCKQRRGGKQALVPRAKATLNASSQHGTWCSGLKEILALSHLSCALRVSVRRIPERIPNS